MKSVALLDTEKNPQNPVHPAMARRMLRDGQAAVYRRHPFTIIHQAPAPAIGSQLSLFAPAPAPAGQEPESLRLKIDPGSRTTGIAIVNDRRREILWAAELKHRGPEIKKALDKRRALRRGRRNRQTRYRPARFSNRRPGQCHRCGCNRAKDKSLCRPCANGELPRRTKPLVTRLAPSMMSRVYNVQTWTRRLCSAFPIGAISLEIVKFDTQLLQNPNIGGLEYQQGTLAGYERKEYLLEICQRKCAYCRKTGVPMEVEHITPKSRGGSDRISNLTIACQPCNQKKGNQTAAEFGYPEVQKRVLPPLKDAAMMNATRYAIRDLLAGFGRPIETGTGGRTKFNRTCAGMDKSHWADAACVGASTPERWWIPGGSPVYRIRARSYPTSLLPGRRQVSRVCKVGFPHPCGHKGKECKPQKTGSAKRGVRFFGYRTGDVVKVVKAKGKWAGVYRGRISVRASGKFDFYPRNKEKQPESFRAKEIVKLLDRCGSYEYSAHKLAAAAGGKPPPAGMV